MKTEANHLAFPQTITPEWQNTTGNQFDGLTKREYLAMDLYARFVDLTNDHYHFQGAAERAIKAADVLLAELNKEQL